MLIRACTQDGGTWGRGVVMDDWTCPRAEGRTLDLGRQTRKMDTECLIMCRSKSD